METTVLELDSVRYLSGVNGKKLIQAESDISNLLGVCYDKDVFIVLLYKNNLPQDFTKLESGQAGMVLNKFTINKLKLAVVVDKSDLKNKKFNAMADELNMYNSMIHIFTEANHAARWLTG
jgi:hypothetical protein